MTIRLARLLCSSVLALLVAALPAAAQDRRETFVRGLGGVTFGTETAGVFGGGVGVGVARNVQVYFELGYITSILPGDAQDMLGDLFDELGVSVSDFEASAPSFYGLFGGRFQPSREGMQPFAEALFGFAHTTGKFSAVVDGIPISSDDVPIDVGLTSTDPVLALGGGLFVPISRDVGIELGYRLLMVFLEERQNVSKVYGAVRWNF
jgi:hypothetical protein